ncbi:MAG: exo-beta-N-acetylmuramidase NamZ domain-containing protein [Candidatus Cryptobacteroides sp.]
MFSFRTTRLEDQLDKALVDGKVGCFCTQNCWDTSGDRYMWQVFKDRGNLERLFQPEDAELTPGTNHIHFDSDSLRGLNAVVVEIQDVGVRYFNYTKDVMRLMMLLTVLDEPPALYIVDHFNPAGRVVEGSVPEDECEPFVPRVAHRHGLTLGELCSLFYAEIGARYPLHVISAMASDYNKDILPWTIAPASDIPGMFTCYMYSGGGLWNNTNITPGIGTARPYEYFGAPFITHGPFDRLPVQEGVLMRPCSFKPSAGQYSGQMCYGYQIMLKPGAQYHSLLHTLLLVRYFRDRYPQFELSEGFWKKLSDSTLAAYLRGEVSFQEAREHVKLEEQKWIRKAKRFILYDDAPYRMK